jgi:hypothetical protein
MWYVEWKLDEAGSTVFSSEDVSVGRRVIWIEGDLGGDWRVLGWLHVRAVRVYTSSTGPRSLLMLGFVRSANVSIMPTLVEARYSEQLHFIQDMESLLSIILCSYDCASKKTW